MQEEGVLFLPFEQRMTRDMQARRHSRQARMPNPNLMLHAG